MCPRGRKPFLPPPTTTTSPVLNITHAGRGRANIKTLWTDANKQMQLLCDSLNVTSIKQFVTGGKKNKKHLSVCRIQNGTLGMCVRRGQCLFFLFFGCPSEVFQTQSKLMKKQNIFSIFDDRTGRVSKKGSCYYKIAAKHRFESAKFGMDRIAGSAAKISFIYFSWEMWKQRMLETLER